MIGEFVGGERRVPAAGFSLFRLDGFWELLGIGVLGITGLGDLFGLSAADLLGALSETRALSDPNPSST